MKRYNPIFKDDFGFECQASMKEDSDGDYASVNELKTLLHKRYNYLKGELNIKFNTGDWYRAQEVEIILEELALSD